MHRYEYKVVPAPKKGTKAKGVKTPEGRFATSIEQLLNVMGADGWEYQRAELLPSEERSGLTGSTTQWRNVLVFRRPAESELSTEEVSNWLTPPVEDDAPLARPVPGPEKGLAADTISGPKAIAQDHEDPPLTLNPSAEETEENDVEEKSKQDS